MVVLCCKVKRLDTHLLPPENGVLGDSPELEVEMHCWTLPPNRTLDGGCVRLVADSLAFAL